SRDPALSYLVCEPPSLSVRHGRGAMVDGYDPIYAGRSRLYGEMIPMIRPRWATPGASAALGANPREVIGRDLPSCPRSRQIGVRCSEARKTDNETPHCCVHVRSRRRSVVQRLPAGANLFSG